MKKFGDVFYTDIFSLYPEESISTFGDLKRAEIWYLAQEKTQGMIQRILHEWIENPLAPIEVVPFTCLSSRDKEFLNRIDQLKYCIENGTHRYFAYIQANILINIPTRLRIF